ncbi:MAG: hypothetical protein FIA92_04415 [Chloroflexi bacterium]|nr:hypothetical protein [Chloroflexota bacterium]
MSPPIVVVLTLAGVIVGTVLAWWSGGPPNRPLEPATPTRALTLSLVVLVAAGSIILAAGGATGGPLLAAIAMAAAGAGSILGAWAWGRMAPIPSGTNDSPVRWWVVWLAAIAGLVALGSIVARAGIPLLSLDPQASRPAFGGLVFDAFRWLVPPAALVVLGWALAARTAKRLATAALVVGAVSVLEVLLASRALPFELLLAGLLMAWWSGWRPRPRTWLLLTGLAVVLFFGVLLARMGPEASFRDVPDFLEFAWNRSVGRIVLIQPQTIDVAVEAIPSDEPFWAGATYVRRLSPLLGIPDDHPPLGVWLYERLFPGTEPAFAAPGILAEAWVNAGVPLALGLMLLLGLATQGCGRLLGRLGASPVDRAAAALITVAFVRTYATSLNGFLLTVAVTAAWWAAARPGSVTLVRRALRRPPNPEPRTTAQASARPGQTTPR